MAKNILLIQPPSPERESILTLLHSYKPHIADTPEAGRHTLQTAEKPYDAIFLAGLLLSDMEAITTYLAQSKVHNGTPVIACTETMEAWHHIAYPYFHISRRNNKTGWHILSLLGSLLPRHNLA